MLISKPPPSGKTELDLWNQEVRDVSNNYVQSEFYPISDQGQLAGALKGKHPSRFLTAVNDVAYIELVIPPSLRAFKEAGIRMIPTTTGSIGYTVNFQYGAIGAAFNASSKTAATVGKAVTTNLIYELDLPITTFFTDLAPKDQLAVEFVLDALTTTTEVHILGLYLKFI